MRWLYIKTFFFWEFTVIGDQTFKNVRVYEYLDGGGGPVLFDVYKAFTPRQLMAAALSCPAVVRQ